MSATLNMNEKRIISWKGQTFTEITGHIRMNPGIVDASVNLLKKNLFISPPLKMYRKEIANSTVPSCSGRISRSIDELNMPGGSIVNSTATSQNGLVNVLDINLTNNTTERPGSCNSCVVENPATNARRRVRSSGMIKRQFDIAKNNDTYYTSTSQYLVSRNRTYQQNQYSYIRSGDATVKPGSSLSSNNIYSPNGINHCKKYSIATDVSFQYQWIDGSYNNVDISAGYYSVDDLNYRFKYAMEQNKHYYVNNESQAHVYLLNIAYNNDYDKMEIQVKVAGGSYYGSDTYSYPIIRYQSTSPIYPNWRTPTAVVVPVVRILNNILQTAIGFTSGDYPTNDILSGNQTPLTNQAFLSSSTPGIQPVYVKLYYKPNNPQFAQQGAVSSSSLITRKRYDTITNNGNVYRNAYGLSVANAMAYGVPENGYTYKDKVGYPNIQTPVFSRYTDNIKCALSSPLMRGRIYGSKMKPVVNRKPLL